MLTRRHLRIKVFQALYAYEYDPERGLIKAEKQLRHSIEEINRLYLFDLAALVLIHRYAKERIELNRQKKLPSDSDLNPSLRFAENRFLVWLANNPSFQKALETEHIKFGDEKELIRKIFKDLIEDERYQEYLSAPAKDLKADRKIVKFLYGKYLAENEDLHEVYEARNMHWSDDLDAAQAMVVKTITSFDESREQEGGLVPLIKHQDDMDFALKLFRLSVNEGEKWEQRILAKAEHWEGDRIATVDQILMKIALVELVSFNQIPVKVTLNEYIELAKQYSTKRSGQFVNGILDKLQLEMIKSGEIKKIGRGLL
ncbi:MAG: transcription antitermination factor NusB [Bacteroidetes bacterium]|nr:transcription antitermination factor NusB [Bacteroidota bacterium]